MTASAGGRCSEPGICGSQGVCASVKLVSLVILPILKHASFVYKHSSENRWLAQKQLRDTGVCACACTQTLAQSRCSAGMPSPDLGAERVAWGRALTSRTAVLSKMDCR